MARNLPPAASTFAIMAVPLVGIGAAALLVGEVPRLLDYVAAAFVVVAIAVSVGWGKRP
jgi:drug/metabolite transporter (DMT)-like permease